MDSRIRCEMSQSESLIMEYLWKNDEGKCFSEIMEYLNGELQKNWKKQTINTFIRHLIDKGLVTAEATQKSRRYHAALTPVQFARGKANKILADYYNALSRPFCQHFQAESSSAKSWQTSCKRWWKQILIDRNINRTIRAPVCIKTLEILISSVFYILYSD